MTPEDELQIRQQRAKFIKAFEDIAASTANLAAVSKKQIEITNSLIDTASGLAETVMMPKDGLRDVIDELIDEIRGLREDIRIVVKGSGLQSALASMFPGTKRK